MRFSPSILVLARSCDEMAQKGTPRAANASNSWPEKVSDVSVTVRTPLCQSSWAATTSPGPSADSTRTGRRAEAVMRPFARTRRSAHVVADGRHDAVADHRFACAGRRPAEHLAGHPVVVARPVRTAVPIAVDGAA